MNWSQYNKNLIKRGNINLWISEDIENWWYVKDNNADVKRGHPFTYSNAAIEMCLTYRHLYKLPLRMTEGFVNSLFALAKVNLQCPSYTQVSRRASELQIPKIELKSDKQIHIAFDSTGLKVYGEGEWKVKVHGKSERRTWRKLHVAVDVETLLIVDAKLTENSVDDAEVASNMLTADFDGKIATASGDGAYDKGKYYKAVRRIGAEPIVPPARNARMQKDIIDPAKLPRDEAIAKIKRYGNDEEARKRWKKESNYHKRSLAETTMYRLKRTFSGQLQNRSFDNQLSESLLKVKILNHFANIGLPRNS